MRISAWSSVVFSSDLISSRRWFIILQPSPLRRQGLLAALRDPDSGPAFAGASGYQRNIYAQNRPDRRHELGIDRNLLPPSQQGRAKADRDKLLGADPARKPQLL